MMLAVLLSILFTLTTTEGDEIQVKTSVGTFIGLSQEVKTADKELQKLQKFLGIPYAEAPVGNLRFAKPVPKAPLKTPMEAKVFGSQCLQNYRGRTQNPIDSEDCLFLNIYAPLSREKLPVMIWIHGGGFVSGSSNIYVADEIAATGNVLVITINYRLTVWGFLSTGDSSAPGNYGLWDQHLAIQWVHDNIQHFGGNPDMVTIFGESAGSASVIYQALFPGNRGLFHRIIAQSGTIAASWAQSKKPTAYTNHLASMLKCETPGSRDMLKCLRNVNASNISDLINKPSEGLQGIFPSPFLPSIDGEFVKHSSEDILSVNCKAADEVRKLFSSFDLLTGITSGEGLLYIQFPDFGVNASKHFLPNRSYFNDVLVPAFLNKTVTTDISLLTTLREVVSAEYTDWRDTDNPISIREHYVDMIGDREFLSPLIQTLDIRTGFSSKGATYMYYFDAGSATHVLPSTPAWFSRANHADDLKYIFKLAIPGLENGLDLTSDWERVLSKNMMKLWTNFAKTGDPNKPQKVVPDWLQYTKSDKNYLNILPYKLSMKQNLEDRAVNFWSKVIPSIMDLADIRDNIKTCNKYENCKP